MPTIQFTFSKQDNKHFASADGGAKFYVGSEVTYQGNHGLANLRTADGPVYKPEEYEAKYSHWAWFLHPTAQCESKGSFHCLNTYDRAAFTFTFMQFAAHVPEGDFVHFMRALLQMPEAKDYFPFLELREGHVWYVRNQQARPLETSASTVALMQYLNQDDTNVDEQELIASARMVHWAQHSAAHRSTQVSKAVELFQEKMREHSTRFNLDGWPDYVCHAICDIFHQGRAKYQLVRDILASSPNRDTVYQKLLNVGAEAYAERVKTLKAVHKQLRDSGKFGKKYDAKKNAFK